MNRWILLLAAALCGCTSKEVVVVYSPHGREMLGDYERLFEAAHPEIDLQCFDMGAKEVHSRIAAERGRPRADVWWGAPSTLLMQAANEDLLDPYTPEWADAIAPDHKDPKNRWMATFLSPLAIMFNTNGLDAEQAPASWDALLEDQWKGRITLRKPLDSGTLRTFLCAMIKRQPTEDEGIAWLKKLHAATASYPENPGLLFDHLKKNPDRVSVWLMPDVVLQRVANGFPFAYVVPRPTPVLTDGIALVKDAPNPEGGRLFYEFVTTREALIQQAHTYAKLPARADIDRADLPPRLVEFEVEPMPIDWAEFAENDKRWCDRWEKEVYLAKKDPA